MIIQKIELENFMCYSGKNVFEFTEGINVIIGDNGHGKSKLYDAFYWVLYDQVFVSETKKFQPTRAVKSKLISDKAKSQCTNGKISASVNITFHNQQRNNVYILERRYSATIKNGELVEDNESDLTVLHKELAYLNAKMVNDEERKREIIEKILPANIKDYLWFQGEQVESIIDFNKQDTLTKAINVLSNIKRYDEIKELASAAAKSANREFDAEVRRLSKDTDKSEMLEKDKERLNSQLAGLLEDELENNENLSRAEEKCESLLNSQADATKVRVLQQKRTDLKRRAQELSESLLEEQSMFHRKMFRNKWVIKGTEAMQRTFAEKFSKYERQKLDAEVELQVKNRIDKEAGHALKTRLPFNVPEPNYLEWMLDGERCLVCDREAKRDSDAWLKIKELLDRPKEKAGTNKESLTSYDFTGDFKRLYTNGLSLVGNIRSIDSEINETLKKRQQIESRLSDTTTDLTNLENELEKLISDTALSPDVAENILNEYLIQNKYSKEYTEKKTKLTLKIENIRSGVKNIDDQLKDLVTGSIPQWLVDKKEVVNDFETVANSTRDRVFSNLIAQLEEEANEHYSAMTAGNKSAKGRIRLKQLPNGNYMPEIIDSKGIPLLGSNTSNIILVKLSAIMAIVSAKSSTGVVDFYTLITDAPTSVFGEDYTIGFCKTVSKVYRQSIIMSKEFAKNETLRSELIRNPEIKIGKVYTITPSITEMERGDRNNLSTNIQLLN